VLADLVGDGHVDKIDAFNQFDLRSALDQDWLNLQSYKTHYGYRTWLPGDPPDGDGRPLDGSWTCDNGRMHVTDVDGDGRDDVLAATDNSVDIYTKITSVGLYQRMRFLDSPAPGVLGAAKAEDMSHLWTGDCKQFQPDLVMGDFNGDGLEDAFYPPHEYSTDYPYAVVRWNVGNGFAPETQMPITGPDPQQLTDLMIQPLPIGKDGTPVSWDRGTRTADVNGDGRTDIIAFRLVALGCFDDNAHLGCSNYRTIVVAYISEGDHFRGQIIKQWDNGGVSLASGFTTGQIGDVTGDGAVDVVHVVDGDGKIHVVQLPWRQQPDRLKYVRDDGSYYPLEGFSYATNWWGSDGRPLPISCQYPVSCSRRAFTVVQQHAVFAGTRPDGSAMYREFRHQYQDPRTDVRGRGFLGFGVHRIWDEGLGRETLLKFDFSAVDFHPDPKVPGGEFYPYVGKPVEVRTITPIAPLPTQAELSSSVVMPGLMNQDKFPVRVIDTKRTFSLKSALGGHVISVLDHTSKSLEYETEASAYKATDVPYYTWLGDPTGEPTVRSESFTYDDYGNVKHEEHVTEKGVHEVIDFTYEYRLIDTFAQPPPFFEPDDQDMLVGLPTTSETMSYTGTSTNGPYQPAAGHIKRLVRTEYNALGLVKSVRISGRDTLYQCIPSPTDPESCELHGAKTMFQRNTRGLVTDSTSTAKDVAAARHEHYTWDNEGVYVAQVTDAKGFTTTSLEHPALGVPILQVDALGVTAKLKYDGFGRLRHTTRPGAPTQEWLYGAWSSNQRRGLSTTETDADGSKAQLLTDELERPIRNYVLGFNGTWAVSRTEYNAFGLHELVSRPDLNAPSPHEASWTYDRLGRTLTEKGPDGAKTIYKHKQFSSTATDPNGHTRFVIVDRDGRVTKSGHYVGLASNEYGEVSFVYGDFGQVSGIIDAQNNAISMTYDALGRRIKVNDPDTGVTTSKYNGFGERVSDTTADNQTTTRAYDVLGRVVHSTGPDGDSTFVWDAAPHAAGRLVSTTGPDTSTTYDYDVLGRLWRASRTVDGETYEIARNYDSYGRLKHLFYPQVQGRARFTTHYLYNNHGYLSAIDDVTGCPITPQPLLVNTASVHFLDPTWFNLHNPDPSDVVFKPAPNLCLFRNLWRVNSRTPDLAIQGASLGGAIAVDRVHDPVTGRLEQVAVPAAGEVTTYDYDDDGQVHSRGDKKTGRTETFDYDPLHRLTGWDISKASKKGSIPVSSATYSYDELGNLKTVTRDGSSEFSASYGAQNKPHAISSSSVEGDFTYDDRGRQLTAGARTITYSQFDLPRKITEDAATTTFEYDENGNRASKTRTAGTVESTVYIGGLYERRRTPTSDDHVFYVIGEPGVVAQITYAGPKTITRFIVGDGLESATLVLDGSGAIVEKSYFDPFGERVDSQGKPSDDPDPDTTIGFTGHHDDEHNLIDMRGRIYDRAQYRFLTPDPLVADPLFGQAYNPYSYVLNNPVRFTDPSGLQVCGGEESCVDPNDPNKTIYEPPTSVTKVCGDAALCGGPQETPAQPQMSGTIRSDSDAGSDAVGALHKSFDPRISVKIVEKTIADLQYFQYGTPGGELPKLAPPPKEEPPADYSEVMCGGSRCGDYGGPPLKIVAELIQPEIALLDVADAAQHDKPGDAIVAGVGALPIGGGGLLAMRRLGSGLAGARPFVYSVAFEARLEPLPLGVARASTYEAYAAHFTEANKQLLESMANPELAEAFQAAGVQYSWPLKLSGSPPGWTWHHVADQPGVLQLVPRQQHAPGSLWQVLLHPEGRGGMAEWGFQY